VKKNSPSLYETSLNLFKDNYFLQALEKIQQQPHQTPEDLELIAKCHYNLEEFEEALSNFLELSKSNVEKKKYSTDIGLCYLKQGNFEHAISAFSFSLNSTPDDKQLLYLLADCYFKQGKLHQAHNYYEKILALDPNQPESYSGKLFVSNYFNSLSPQEIFKEHKLFGELLEKKITPFNHKPKPLPKKLRIAYVSADFKIHSVAFFIYPIIKHHDNENFEVFCYSNSKTYDEVSEQIENACAHFENIHALSDKELAQKIYDDKIDILIDLSGHTGGNRLETFAYKPAPLQFTYLGYPNTTGLSRINYRLCDAFTDPKEHDKLHTETLLRLPHGFLCYYPAKPHLEVSPAPFIKNNFITFGSFNNWNKITKEVIEVWSLILKFTPNSRILLKNPSIGEETNRKVMLKMFMRNGVKEEQLQWLPYQETTHDHLNSFKYIDISLDPFPYNGTTSCCESLWMGVPFISLCGNSHVSRVGHSILSHLNLADLSSFSKKEYIQKSISLAQNPQLIKKLRESLRLRLLDSSLTQPKLITQSIEKVYIDSWKTL
jgi:protein O-GlcNAc transferase